MNTEWPHKSPYEEAAARLRDAILVVSLRDAINQASAQMDNAARDHVANNHPRRPRHPHQRKRTAMTTIGSLFTGYGGLDMGVAMAIDPDARVAWTSDVEPGPCKLATVRWPDTPNLGDITKINWVDVEPVDIICGGSPCQDLSLAGKRAGMATGTRSGLWGSMAAAVETIRPRLVVWENVLGALSARAYSPVEQEPGMLGNESTGPLVRAAGRVAGDLAALGYDCRWAVVRASDAGAPHQRARFVEWMMGLPVGYVSTPSLQLAHDQRMDLLYSGTVPLQAAHAAASGMSRVYQP